MHNAQRCALIKYFSFSYFHHSIPLVGGWCPTLRALHVFGSAKPLVAWFLLFVGFVVRDEHTKTITRINRLNFISCSMSVFCFLSIFVGARQICASRTDATAAAATVFVDNNNNNNNFGIKRIAFA